MKEKEAAAMYSKEIEKNDIAHVGNLIQTSVVIINVAESSRLLLFGRKGQKLSKRNPDYKKYELDYYRRKGYLPQTLLNWLLSSGGGFTDEAPWFPGMSVEDLIDRVRQKSNALL